MQTGEAVLLLALDGSGGEPLTATGGEEDPKFSPDGSRVAFVRDFDLHLVDLATGDERRLTTGGRENELLHGVTDWVYWEEIWNRDSTGFWWSPDGSRLAYYEFDETPVPEYPLVDYLTTDPELHWQRYPKSGDPLPLVRVGVLDLETGETTWMDYRGAGGSLPGPRPLEPGRRAPGHQPAQPRPEPARSARLRPGDRRLRLAPDGDLADLDQPAR